MNNVRLIFSLLVFGVCLNSCDAIEKTDQEEEKRVIFNLPPFDSITDSINAFPGSASLYLERAVRLSQHNYHKLATEDYQQAWELSQDENILLAYISNLLLSAEYHQAVERLNEGARRFDHNPEFSRRLGEVYMQLDLPEKALAEYDKMLARDSTDFEVWFEKGMLLARMKDTSAAIRALEHSYANMPIAFSGLALANLYVSVKDDRALEICNRILEGDSSIHQIDALFLKGLYYAQTGKPTIALEMFDACIRRDWKFLEAHLEKGIVHFKERQYSKALEVFRMAGTVSNTVADPYYWEGRVHEAEGNFSEARVSYQRALSLEPGFVEAEIRLRNLDGSGG